MLNVPCISLREPFCSLVLNGFKILETRKWPGACAWERAREVENCWFAVAI